MTGKGKLTLDISSEALEALQGLKSRLPKTKSQQLSAAIKLAQYIVEIEDREDPIILVSGNIEVTNRPFRLEREIKFQEAISKLSVNDKSIMEEIYNSAQLKPSFLGFGIDLKPLLKLAAGFFKKSSDA